MTGGRDVSYAAGAEVSRGARGDGSAFIRADVVEDAAQLLAMDREVVFDPWAPSYFLRLSPGTVALSSRRGYGFDLVAEVDQFLGEDENAPTRDAITEWSSKSRARMVRAIAELDLDAWAAEPGDFALVTLTLPGEWLSVCPTGRKFKAMVRALRERWRRAVGDPRALWKLEFQDRGAPHWHALMKVPAMVGTETFEAWLARSWSEVVNHPDPVQRSRHLAKGTDVEFSGEKFSNPRRVAVYFLKHSAKTTDGKEYQHIVPEAWRGEGKGPGRFWGVWGLERAVRQVCISREDFFAARRMMRGVARGRDARMSILRAQWQGTSSVNFKRRRTRALAHDCSGGWIMVNDGPSVALAIGRMLTLRDTSSTPREFRSVQRPAEVVRGNHRYTPSGFLISHPSRT